MFLPPELWEALAQQQGSSGYVPPQSRVVRTVPKYHIAVQRGTTWEHLGYGTFGLNLVKGLRDLGAEVWEPKGVDDYWEVPTGYRTMVHATVPGHTRGTWEGQLAVAFTMWESDHLPPVFVENLHNFDMVVVPCQQNVDIFSAHHDNVKKVPLGYDRNAWKPMDREPPTKEFNFLWCGAGLGEKARKGSDLAIAAFERAFPNWETMTPRPRLLMKCLLRGSQEPARGFAEVHVGAWSLDKLKALYGRASALILPSRGEGWGYHPMQAVATGIPAIVSDIPGTSEYTWLPGFWVAPTKRTKAAYFLQGDAGYWWEADLDSLVEGLRSIYDNYTSWKKEAEEGAIQIANQYSHVAMARKLCEAVGKENLVQTKTGPWQEFSIKTYLARSTVNLDGRTECRIGDVAYDWVAGRDYWRPSNVRLVMEEAGYLEPGLPETGKLDSCDHRPELVK